MTNSCKTALPFREDARLPRRRVIAWLAASLALAARGTATAGKAHGAPPMMLAGVYRQGIDLAGYAVSEKYDGVRGYWDGRKLWTRGGEPVHAPAWFSAGWPAMPMDGELWAGHGRFAHAVSTVRTQTPDDAAWRTMKFMVFDLPSQPGSYTARSAVLERAVPALGQDWVVAVGHSPAPGHAALKTLMEKTVAEGGEGVVLRKLDAPWRAGRSRDLLKYKPDEDADALVLAHVPGRGKYEGMMGALLVETAEGTRFRLGTGFDDATRRHPPAVGTWVSFRYRGENDSGIPRFASYLRVRADMPHRS